MDRLTLKIGKVAVVLAPIFLILPFALAEDAKYVGEDYYGNDINAAVLEANQNKRQLNYNRQHWYNRTTSKSFELDPLPGAELETERLEGALGVTAAGGETNVANPNLPAEEQSEQVQKDILQNSLTTETSITINKPNTETFSAPAIPTSKISHQFPRGDRVTTTGIISSGTVTSTPIP